MPICTCTVSFMKGVQQWSRQVFINKMSWQTRSRVKLTLVLISNSVGSTYWNFIIVFTLHRTTHWNQWQKSWVKSIWSIILHNTIQKTYQFCTWNWIFSPEVKWISKLLISEIFWTFKWTRISFELEFNMSRGRLPLMLSLLTSNVALVGYIWTDGPSNIWRMSYLMKFTINIY